MTERFDLEKWLRDRGFTTATEFRFTHWPFHFEDLKGLIEAAENHQREMMLAPSPCPNGCRMCDWVEKGQLEVDGTWTPRCERCAKLELCRALALAAAEAVARREGCICGGGNNHVRTCPQRIANNITRVTPTESCAELERVRQLERAAALEQACKAICVNCAEGFPFNTTSHNHHVSGGYCYAWAIRAIISAEAQGGPKETK